MNSGGKPALGSPDRVQRDDRRYVDQPCHLHNAHARSCQNQMLGHEQSLSHFDILALVLIAVLMSGPSHALEVDKEHLG